MEKLVNLIWIVGIVMVSLIFTFILYVVISITEAPEEKTQCEKNLPRHIECTWQAPKGIKGNENENTNL